MKTLGPFIAQENRPDAPLFWYHFTLGGHQDKSLWAILRTPFREDGALLLPEDFKTYDPAPLVLHAFDPAYGSYFSFSITTEHALLRFRPTGIVREEKPLFNTEQYTGQAWIPTRTSFEITQYQTQMMSEKLTANHGELKSIIQVQYQASLPPPAWSGQEQNIPEPSHFPENIRGLWSTNGFFSAWNDLKSASNTPEIYCHALISIIAQGEKASDACSLSETNNIADEARLLKRYLTDTSIYKPATPLDAALFETTRNALLSELNIYRITLTNPAELKLNTDELLTFQQAKDELIRNQHFSSQASEEIATNLFFMLTAQAHIPVKMARLRDLETHLKAILKSNVAYGDIYIQLNNQFTAHFPDESLNTRLHGLLNETQRKQKDLLRAQINILLRLNPNASQLLAKLLPLLQTSGEVRIAFKQTEFRIEKNAFLDALNLDNESTPFLQSIEDLSELTAELKNTNIKYLFTKRTAHDWGSLVQSPDGLKRICAVFLAPEKKKIIAQHAAYFASLINSTETVLHILHALTTENLKQLLRHIPTAITRHWIQTPNHLQAFLTISTQNQTHQKNAFAILEAIPSPYRVTALMQSDIPEEKIKALLAGSAFMFQLYWDAISPAEWAVVLKTPKPLIKALMKENTAAGFSPHKRITYLLSSLKEKLSTHLISTSLFQDSVTPLTNFEHLKRFVIGIFPHRGHNQSFFPAEATVFPNTSALQHARDAPALKHALMEIYCLTSDLGVEMAVINACYTIKAHEAENAAAPQNLKRARISLD